MINEEQFNKMFGTDLAQQSTPNDNSRYKPQNDTQQQNKPKGIIENVVDTVKGVLAGPAKEVENTFQTVHDVANFVDNKFLGDKYVDNDKDYDFVPESIKPQGGIGKTAEALSAFATGWIASTKAISWVQGAKAAKAVATGTAVAKTAPKGMIAKTLENVAKGGIVDFVTQDTSGERLADVFVNNDVFRNGLTEYLSKTNNPNESAVEARFKNVLEGAMLGLATDTVFGVFKAIKGNAAKTVGGTVEKAITGRKMTFEQLNERLTKAGLTDDAIKAVKDTSASFFESDLTDKAKIANMGTDMMDDFPGFIRNVKEAKSRLNSRGLAEPTKDVVDNLGRSELYKDIAESNSIRMTDTIIEGAETIDKVTNHFKESGCDALISAMDNYTGKGVNARKIVTSDLWLNSVGQSKLAQARQNVLDVAQDNIMHGACVTELQKTTKDTIKMALYRAEIASEGGQTLQAANRVRTLKQLEKGVTGNPQNLLQTGITAEDASKMFNGIIDGFDEEQLLTFTAQATDMLQKADVTSVTKLAASMSPKTAELQKLLGQSSWGQTIVANVMDWRMVSMLSSFKTQLRNVVGQTVKTPITIFEDVTQKAIMDAMDAPSGSKMVGALSGIKDGSAHWAQGLQYGFNQACKNFKTALQTGQAIYRSEGNEVGKTMLDAANSGRIFSTKIGRMFNPGTLMNAVDDFFSTLLGTAKSYENAMNTLKASKALEGVTDPNTINEIKSAYLEYFMSKTTLPARMATGQIIEQGATASKSALGVAEDVVFQQKLEGIWQKIDAIAKNNKAVRMILPFTKTPANIMLDVFSRRNPLIQAYKLKDAYLSGNKQAVAETMSRILSGTLLWTGAGMMLSSGMLIGNGPKNKQQREALQRMGVQFNSIKLGDKYVDLNAIQPYGSILQCLAVTHEYLDSNGKTMEDVPDLMDGVCQGIAAVCKDQTYMKGLSDFIDAINNPTRKGQSYATQIATSFVPMLLRDFGVLNDPVQRQTPDFWSSIINKIDIDAQSRAENLAPKVDWLTGLDKELSYGGTWSGFFNPFKITQENKSAVFYELTRVEGVTPPDDKIGQTQLSPFEYADLCRTIGTCKIDGKTLLETLDAFINSDTYRQDVLNAPDPTPYKLQKDRNTQITRIIKAFKDRGEKDFINSHPEIIKRDSVYEGAMEYENAMQGFAKL